MNLQEDKKKITEEFLEGINICNLELFSFVKQHFAAIKPIFPLVDFIINRLSVVTDLAIQGYNWDAEIIYRSALECLVKLTFISSAEGVERELRLKEYWDDLWEVGLLKQSDQAKKSLAIHGHDEALRLAFIPMVLSDDKEREIRGRWPRAERHKLEQKWSFSEMIVSISKDYNGSAVEAFIGLGHNYRYASHVSHADETGVSIINERAGRQKEEREVADFMHYIRLLSDSFYFSITTAVHTVTFVNKDPKFFIDLGKSKEEIKKISKVYRDKLHEDELYDKFK